MSLWDRYLLNLITVTGSGDTATGGPLEVISPFEDQTTGLSIAVTTTGHTSDQIVGLVGDETFTDGSLILRYVGETTVDGVTGYVGTDDLGDYYLYVPSGSTLNGNPSSISFSVDAANGASGSPASNTWGTLTWDRYELNLATQTGSGDTATGGTLDFISPFENKTIGLSIAATSAGHTADTTIGVVGDETFTDGSLTLTYVGSTTVDGVTGYVGTTDSGDYFLYVPTGSTLSGNPGSVSFNVDAANGASGNPASNTWAAAACFLAGTLIATPDGARPVETLAAGDLVRTADGASRTVRWLGRSVVARLFADPLRVQPVRICAGALGENIPCRDLLVSPEHALLIDGVLVHAGALVNGSTVVRATLPSPTYTYYHVELDAHALLLAEGAVAESYLDGIADIRFDNVADRPARAEPMRELDVPRVKSARQVSHAVRRLLAARAAAITPQATLAA